MQTEDIKPAIFCVHCLPHSRASRTGDLVTEQIIMCYQIAIFSEHLIRVTLYFSKKWTVCFEFNLPIRKGVKKPDLFGTLTQTMGRWVHSPKLFSENNHSVIFTANIQKCPKTCNT